MSDINTCILWIMMTFMAIGAIDRILNQFGGSAAILSKIRLQPIGKAIEGAGIQLEEGFMAMGALALAMVGVMALAPVLAQLLGGIVTPIYTALGASPAMFATTLLAIDMGGYTLAGELAGGDIAAWMYAGVLLGSMMGATLVFTIPVGLGIIRKEDRRFLAMGILAGIVTIPVGCIAGGLAGMASDIVINGQPVTFTLSMLVVNMIPVMLVALLVGLGLKYIPEQMIAGFHVFARILVVVITIGLACAVLQDQTGFVVIPGMAPIFSDTHAINGDYRAIEVIGKIACILLGAYPMMFLITRWLRKPLLKIGGMLRMNDAAAAGMVASLANNIPMFGLLHRMDDRGKVLNVAFAVSAAFTFGDHLGFVAAVASPMIFPLIVGKLTGGITAIFVAMLIAPKPSEEKKS